MGKLKNGIFHGIMGILLGFALLFGIKFFMDEIKLSKFESVYSICVNNGSNSEPHYYLNYYVDSEEYSVDLDKELFVSYKEGDTVELFYNKSNPSQIVFKSTPIGDIILLCGCMIIFTILKVFE